MKLSLSTNWCNRRIESGEAIADLALALGFDELELGYHTTIQQADGFRKSRGRIPVGSVHAFCPVPLSAPQGYPELYALAAREADERAIARIHILRNIRFCSDIGADTLVLHAGRVPLGSFFSRLSSGWLKALFIVCKRDAKDPKYAKALERARKRRTERGAKMLDLFHAELDRLVPELEKAGVTLALENLPYYEGFPLPGEMETILGWGFGERVKAWYDTGHARVCENLGWTAPEPNLAAKGDRIAGMHLNDVKDLNDDHLAPGFGSVDFKALKPLAEKVRHVVFEPNAFVKEEDLRTGLANIRRDWEL